MHQVGTEFDLEPEPATQRAPGAGRSSEVDVGSEARAAEAVLPGESAPPPGRPSRDRLFFPLGAGYGALGRIDLSHCRDEGLEPGYWHVRATFRRSGRIVHASVESATAPSPEALACIGEELEGPTVPRFDGEDVTLSKSFFVQPQPARAPAGRGVEDIEVQTQPPGSGEIVANVRPLEGASVQLGAP